MTAEIITIGDEILIGQTVDTNSAWIAQQLNDLSIPIHQITSIADTNNAIIQALEKAKNRSSIVFITGGLGPTKDDITKKALCNFFEVELKLHEPTLDHVKALFTSFDIKMPAVNEQQAWLPSNCTPLFNKLGTAPGMWFKENGVIYISMPGVPYEMKGLMTNEVIPRLQEKNGNQTITHQTIMTAGIGESPLMEKIEGWENSLYQKNIKLAYLPSPGIVKLRLTKEGDNEAEIKKEISIKIKELKSLIPEYLYASSEQKLEEKIGELLLKNNATLATAESCTGGKIASQITAISGSSNYFKGSVIAYANEVKIDQLGVNENDLKQFGAVSQQVVEQMATGVQKVLKTDYTIATSGIAGPTGGTKEKPVGTIWIAIATPKGVFSKKLSLSKNRGININYTCAIALNELRKKIEN